MPALMALGGLSMAVVGGFGFAASYSTLYDAAIRWGYSPLIATGFPIAVDASIVAFFIADMILIYKRTPWPVMLLAAHVMTGVTIGLNAAAHGNPLDHPARSLAHAVMPALFAAGIGAVRRLVIKAARLADGRDTAGAPVYRWILAPTATFKLWRRMKLWELRSYTQVVGMEQDRRVYRARLQQKYGRNWRRLAEAYEQLPLTMARYGLSVDDALLIPEREAAADAERDRLKEERKERAAAADRARKTAAHDEENRATIARMRSDAAVADEQQLLDTRADELAAQRAARAGAAERAALDDQAAAESETAAAARLRAVELDRQAVAAAAQLVEERAQTVEVERKVTADARRAADEKAAALAVEQQNLRDAAALKTETVRLVELERRAVELRAQVVELEAREREAEWEAGLSDTERAARRVARHALREADGDVDAVPVELVAEMLGVSENTARRRRAEAAEMIADGSVRLAALSS